MLKTLGAAGIGGALGGLGGQVSDALSMPRRALWSALGLPETGRELAADAFGLDPEGFGAGALGMGAEFLLDPLTLAGAFGGTAGRLGTKLAFPGMTAQDARLLKFANQAATAADPLGELSGLGRTVGVGEPAAIPLLQQSPMASAPISAAEFIPNEITPWLDDMAMRTNSRNMAWDALAAVRRRNAAGALSDSELAFNQMMAGPPDGVSLPGTPSLPGTNVELPAFRSPMPPEGPYSFTAEQIRAGALPPGMLPPGVGDGVDLAGMLPPAPQATQANLSQLMAAMPPTNPTVPSAPLGPPLALPAELNAGLLDGYGPGALGNVPQMPLGTPAYKLVNPEVSAILAELGIPPEMFSRGGLPPWAQVRGGRVGLQPGIMAEDVLRGARGAAGY